MNSENTGMVIAAIVFTIFVITTLLLIFWPRSDDGDDGGDITVAFDGSGFTDPSRMTIDKVTDKVVTFSEKLNFEVVDKRSSMYMLLGIKGTSTVVAERRGMNLNSDTKDIDLSTFMVVNGGGARFTRLIEGFGYYIQIVFTAPGEPTIKDKGYIYEFVAPVKIVFGVGTTYELPVDASKGKLVWVWKNKEKKMDAKYVRVGSGVPWFGGEADFEDDIKDVYFPGTATYMLVKSPNYYYRIEDGKLVDAYDNDTELDEEVSSSSVTTYAT
jgi:hypothetical protein